MENVYKWEKESGLKFAYYDNFLPEDFALEVFKILKEIITIKKDLIHNTVNETYANEEKLNLYLKTKVPFNKAINSIIESFNKIDRRFGNFIIYHLQNGLVDVYLRKNKYLTPRNISFSKFLPTFILLNYEKNLSNLPHVIHEFAHALHTEFLRKFNSPLNNGQSVILRETIAMFFEILILEDLKSKFNEEAIELYLKKLKITGVFYNFVLCLTTEDIYKYYKKNKHITFNKISEIFKKHLKVVLGKTPNNLPQYEILFHLSKGFWWHFPYIIATILANTLVDEFYKDKNKFKNKLSNLLKSGSNKSLIKIFKEIGFDVYRKDFWLKTIERLSINF